MWTSQQVRGVGTTTTTHGGFSEVHVVFSAAEGGVQVHQRDAQRVFEIPVSNALHTLAQSLTLVAREMQSAHGHTMVVINEYGDHPFTVGPYLDVLLKETFGSYGVPFMIARLAT